MNENRKNGENDTIALKEGDSIVFFIFLYSRFSYIYCFDFNIKIKSGNI